MSLFRKSMPFAAAVVAAACEYAWAAPGESAVITLVFPPGARATGMAETFTGMADDVNATFFNPAGLGQPPLSNSWHFHFDKSTDVFTAVAARKKKPFSMRDEIWVGTNRGLLRYNGKSWETSVTYVIEEKDNLNRIAAKYMATEDEAVQEKAIFSIMRENKISMQRLENIKQLLSKNLLDSAFRATGLDDLGRQIVTLPLEERNSTKVYGLIASRVDSSTADTLSEQIAKILDEKDIDLDKLVELKIPFSLAVSESVTAMTFDEAEQLWVGTAHGLWRYDGASWKLISMLEGLPSNAITCLAAGPYGMVAAGTDRGCAVLSDGVWKSYTTEAGLPDSGVTAVALGKSGALYVGTSKGLAQRKDSVWTTLDTGNGLLSQTVSALLYDSEGKLWIGGPNGVTIYDELSWRRFKFPDSRIHSFLEVRPGEVWIATSKGAITSKAITVRVKDPATGESKAKPMLEWNAFHSRNGLRGDDVKAMALHGKDVWLVTDQAVNHYDKAEKQLMSFWEPLLPAFGIRDLWHLYFGGVFPTGEWGTMGFLINYINMGTNTFTDELGREIAHVRSFEVVAALCYGLSLKENLSVGVNAKGVISALAPGIGEGSEGVGYDFALDAGVLWRNMLIKNLDLGFMMQNMGPPIFYIKKEQSDPIPFTLRLGLAYRAVQTPVHELTFAADFDREVVDRNELNWEEPPYPFWKALYTDLLKKDPGETSQNHLREQAQEILVHVGTEYWYVNFLALRTGFMLDYLGERYEWTFGLGLKYGNVNVDWSYIHSPEGFLKKFLQNINPEKEGGTGARHGQWRISLIGRF